MICDDALSSAIDSRKFASEFINRRNADLNGVPYSAPTVDNDGGWTSVKKNVSGNNTSGASPNGGAGSAAADDGFEVVGKKKKGRK